MVLAIGGMNILVDLGRPDRFLNVFWYGRYQSPLLWDATSISAYFTASTVYLWLPMIPDIAILRDRTRGLRHFVYQVLAIGWRGTKKQIRALNRGIVVMSILVIPIAVSVHTVVSFVFSMTLQPMWHSTIFGPYFVVGAIFSGIAALIIAMLILRKVYHLEAYLKEVHFRHLGSLLLAMTLLWTYFTFAEYLTAWYGGEEAELATFWSKVAGPYAVPFWLMVISCFLIPLGLMCRRATRGVWGTTIASAFVALGMWLERYTIVVPTSVHPRIEMPGAGYAASWVELSIMAGTFAGFILVYMVATKFFPIISLWEIQEGREDSIRETSERVKSYLPDDMEVVRS
jgi:molybdopterin-containing oxidoreductase family membrane subunit